MATQQPKSICPHCKNMIIAGSNNKLCTHCELIIPIKRTFNELNLELVVLGYCRVQYISKYNQIYPMVLVKISQKYLNQLIYDRFGYKKEIFFRSNDTPVAKIINQNKYCSTMALLRSI